MLVKQGPSIRLVLKMEQAEELTNNPSDSEGVYTYVQHISFFNRPCTLYLQNPISRINIEKTSLYGLVCIVRGTEYHVYWLECLYSFDFLVRCGNLLRHGRVLLESPIGGCL